MAFKNYFSEIPIQRNGTSGLHTAPARPDSTFTPPPTSMYNTVPNMDSVETDGPNPELGFGSDLFFYIEMEAPGNAAVRPSERATVGA